VTLDDHASAARLNHRSIADELQRVAQALLGVQQNAAALERRSVPERLF